MQLPQARMLAPSLMVIVLLHTRAPSRGLHTLVLSDIGSYLLFVYSYQCQTDLGLSLVGMLGK
jgi:hypothetical protein